MNSPAAETTHLLERKLREAQKAYQSALSEYRRLAAIPAQSSHLDDPALVDGNQAMHKALAIHRRARQEYECALREFTDHVLKNVHRLALPRERSG